MGFVEWCCLSFLIIVTSFRSPTDRSNLHKSGGMASFIETLKSLEGPQQQTTWNERRESYKKFVDVDRVRNGPQFPVDLGLEFSELKTKAGQKSIKAYALSDLHADAEKNQQWVRANCLKTQEDIDNNVFSVLIIPGDIGSEVDRIESVFEAVVQSHDAVCYVPGNHEAWRRGTQLGSSTSATQPELRTSTTTRMSADSCSKIKEVVDVARACGVYTGPLRITLDSTKDLAIEAQVGVRIYPLYSWYHSSWDSEPDLEHAAFRAVEEAIPFSSKWGDFSMCTWPEKLVRHEDFASTRNNNTALAEAWASLNEPFLPPIEEYGLRGSEGNGKARGERDTIISFSHFLPRQELVPEKRFLLEPLLSRVVGSDPLEAQVRRLLPDLHLYGHTHIPLDLEIDGVRYIQWPLGYSREANMQCSPIRKHKALCVYDSSLVTSGDLSDVAAERGIPPMLPSVDCAWSQYYRTQSRNPAVIAPLAPWVLRRLQSFAGFVKGHPEGDDTREAN